MSQKTIKRNREINYSFVPGLFFKWNIEYRIKKDGNEIYKNLPAAPISMIFEYVAKLNILNNFFLYV